jgi:hypothetical protein
VIAIARIVCFLARFPPEHACPLCGAASRAPVGAPYVGTVGVLRWKRSFEERLHRCGEGHVYSVRVERGRGGENVAVDAWESVDEWMQARTGAEPFRRPPGL